ncbi:MAG: hypothetical protein GY779_16330, partial [Gammaproteobacteria bacterium]|nr:hypothetical protein [Gammaproteobacteria bacterium]
MARDPDGSYYTVESAQVQSNWTATDTGSPSYILNLPMTFFVSTGSELATALSSNIANKTIICSNNTLPSIRESLVIPTNTAVKGDNYIYGCRVAFQTFDNTIPAQLPAVYGFNSVEASNIFFYSDFEHWSDAAYPNAVNIDS